MNTAESTDRQQGVAHVLLGLGYEVHVAGQKEEDGRAGRDGEQAPSSFIRKSSTAW